MRGISLQVVVLLPLVACARPVTPPPATSSADLASATAFVDSFLASLAHPTAPEGTVRLDSAAFVWARSGALLGYDSLTTLLGAQRAARTAIVLGTSEAHFTSVGPDAVVWSGIVSGVVRESSGGQRQVRGALTLVLRRHGTGWGIAAGHESVRPYDEDHEAEAAVPH